MLEETENQRILLEANTLLFDIYLRISKILTNEDSFIEHQMKVQNNLKFQINEPADIAVYAYNNLKRSVKSFDENIDCEHQNMENHKEFAKTYVKLAHFIRDKNEENHQSDFIIFVLRAMKMDSLEGRQLFPCVLMQSMLGSNCKNIFIEEVTFLYSEF